MNLSQRIDSFQQLGVFIKQFTENQKNSDIDTLNQIFYDDFLALIEKQKNYNGWFTKESVLLALQGISLWLTSEALCNWVNKYSFIEKLPKNIGVIMAGNIPMVGFHDMLSVLITGNNFVGKCASTDNLLNAFNLQIVLMPTLLQEATTQHVILSIILVNTHILLEKTEIQ